ncbi:DUF3472 domain-containing protein [Dinghuibacter silviterrae]|uniref:Uncharacterized protein DUF5077 n=1 Tax=Dinghuibacter silviterrae TaxID=1539049 RepID=A0A4R8DIU8_9BACT|nr:DUF3472 domain-containing protein [Dinghuibacter silviterrae]TDW96920.1 uncharacterized protein DUF5077 [Dinghuibacter silviterrae]
MYTFLLFAFSALAPDSLVIPLGGNTWSSLGNDIPAAGIEHWSDASEQFTTYFRVSTPGTVHLWVDLEVPQGESQVSVALAGAASAANGAARMLRINASGALHLDAGEWTIKDTGYQAVVIRGLTRTGLVFANIRSLTVTGSALQGPTAYVPNDEGNFFYWGRRGPSVHLSYTYPKDTHIQWFYNEVTVPKGQDVLGSYFMADGFSVGYFGMQVNSPTERHILFSVWSPFTTDDPKAIPDSLRIILLKKGEGVHAGAFGNEGSGGQSYLNYMWKAGNTYRFLLKAQPQDDGHTAFTAWFYAPEEGHWRLIASFSRPQTRGWLTGLHSFLENFEPNQGDKTRYVLFNHQWIGDDQGHWTPLHQARFTGDNTARKGYRLDYAGGVMDGAFFLKNAGFFNERVALDTRFERPAGEETPPELP